MLNPCELRQKAKDIRLFALDLDGTLLNGRQQLTPRTVATIQALLKQNYFVVPTTGRSLTYSVGTYPELAGTQYAISTNGTLVTDLLNKKELFHNSFSRDIAVRLTAELLADAGNLIYINTLSSLRTICRDRVTILDSGQQYKPFGLELDSICSLQDWSLECDEPILEIGLDFMRQDGFDYYGALASSYYPELDYFQVSSSGLEFVSAGSSKYTALHQLCRILGITMEQVCAIGDSGNDIEMLRSAGIGVAMENAIPSTKECADYITDDNEHDGVASFLERFFCYSAGTTT